MLDTIPIVKFGDNNKDEVKPKKEVDIEMAAAANGNTTAQDKSNSGTAEVTEAGSIPAVTGAATNTPNADGTDEAGHLGCSICTEDFNRGEEVRLLPCNHKFHPECVDPWLLNVSGTCPLCRVDLRPMDEQNQSAGEGLTHSD